MPWLISSMLVAMLHPRETGLHSAEWAVIGYFIATTKLISMTIAGSLSAHPGISSGFLFISQQIGTDPSTLFFLLKGQSEIRMID